MDSVLEEDNETTAEGIIWAIVGFVIITAPLAYKVYMMINNKKGEDNGAGTHAGIAGYILGLLFIVFI
jgi:hypothetical protein